MRRLEARKRNLRHSRARTRGRPGPEFHYGGCGWQQRFFGAWYEDAGCIEGWLCDLDSGDAPGSTEPSGAGRAGTDVQREGGSQG